MKLRPLRNPKVGEAAKLHRQTLEVQRRVLGEGHPRTLGSGSNLAVMLRQLGNFAEAAELPVLARDEADSVAA